MVTMSYYFTKENERIPKDSKDREAVDVGLLLHFDDDDKGVAKITFTKDKKDRPTSTSGGDSTGVVIGPTSKGGIGVRWMPSGALVIDDDADDWHLTGKKIDKGGTVAPKKDAPIVPLDPPVPEGANDAHGAIKKEEKKEEKKDK